MPILYAVTILDAVAISGNKVAVSATLLSSASGLLDTLVQNKVDTLTEICAIFIMVCYEYVDMVVYRGNIRRDKLFVGSAPPGECWGIEFSQLYYTSSNENTHTHSYTQMYTDIQIHASSETHTHCYMSTHTQLYEFCTYCPRATTSIHLQSPNYYFQVPSSDIDICRQERRQAQVPIRSA